MSRLVIEDVRAAEILDSRGRPTVRSICLLQGGHRGTASVPSGASTGSAEALELRDGDASRYRGLGCRKAVANVAGPIRSALVGRTISDQAALDGLLLELDGTENKSRLGANAILSVSLAFARAAARQRGLPLYRWLAPVDDGSGRLPRLTVNLFSGGKHAGGQAPLQDVLIVPASARTMDESLAMTFAVYQAAAEHVGAKYGVRLLRADEGGMAPPFPNAEAMLEDAVASITAAGFQPGSQVALAVDVASTHFFDGNCYRLGERVLDSAGMIEQMADWVSRYPIVSLEDALAEEDWRHWPLLVKRLAARCLVVGDDLLTTRPARVRRAINEAAATALLLKVNQVGTLTEAAEALSLARGAGWDVTVSARSGETEDDWLADLAVGWRADQIKVGSITQSERLSKYNRLLEIEAETHWPICPWPGLG